MPNSSSSTFSSRLLSCGRRKKFAQFLVITLGSFVVVSSLLQQEADASASASYSPHAHQAARLLSRRIKRQADAARDTNAATGGASSGAASPASSSGSGLTSEQLSSDTSSGQMAAGDEKSPEETLSSLKCDFGSADAPDLCKFRILESENPLAKGLAVWTLGSGKLALFQGGPLADASPGNDSFGGYIFYETSNPYALNPGDQAQQYQNHTNSHLPHHERLGNDYASVLTPALTHAKPHPASSMKHLNQDRNSQHPQGFQQLSSARVSVGASSPGPAFLSPNMTAPGPAGMCLSFQYAIQGLSAEELRVYVNDHKTGRSRQIWASSESAASNWTRGEVLYSVTNQHSLMFAAASPSAGASSSGSAQMRDLQQRKFRGHLALDEIEINKHDPLALSDTGPCRGHCNFDGDLCGWANAESGQDDNFDWSFGRGSDNLFTGPARDFTSSSNNEPTGSYLYTDSSYPRRPGDRAVLMSPMFQPTAVNDALCMRLAVHMFGSGIGSLAVKIRYADEGAGPSPAGPSGPGAPASGQDAANSSSTSQQPQGANQPLFSAAAGRSQDSAARPNELVIWEMSGDAGNSWHQAQTSVSSSRSPFQVLIEGTIGENHLGNIAIDEISFSSGPCPTSPPVASKNYGDCTFEQSMCYWRNPDADIHLDDLDWVRTADEQTIHGPNQDHTLKRRSGAYLKLENTFREPKSGTRAFLLSPVFQPKASGSVQCLSFYYYMFMRSISPSGPNLGTIRVYLASSNELVPIWRLTNPISSPSWKHGRASLSTSILDGQPQAPSKLFQIAFEGIWGDAASGAIALDDITVFDGACDIMPAEARSVPGECTFDVDLCSWSNKTYDLLSTGAGNDGALDPTDNSRSPFLQSVNSGASGGHQPNNRLNMLGSPMHQSKRQTSWRLATVDSRPVNLQDHTYKAPIGYIYVDVLDSGSQPMAFPLQSSEVSVGQSAQPVALCLSFWFAAYGRQEANQLQVYLTQASAPPQQSDEPADGSQSAARPAGNATPAPAGGAAPATTGAEEAGENSNAWKSINGKLIWRAGLRNITEAQRRKWLYGQVSLKADSNYIVRFVAISQDGGFALDDVSFFDGVCETRPGHARLQSLEDETAELQAPQQPPSTSAQVKPSARR